MSKRAFKRTGYFTVFVASIVATAYVAAGPASTAGWTQWGGAKQEFIAPAGRLAEKWPESGPKKLWERDLGEGYSSILAEGDRLYTMYRKDGQERVVCLSAKDGKTIWEHAYDSKPREGHVMEFGDGPRSTPLISGDRIYAIGIAGKMHCLGKEDGRVYWTHDLWEEFGGNFLNHGYSSSPVAYKDMVIALAGGKDQSIIAFKQSDGAVAWKQHSFENSYSTPKLISVGGKDQFAIFMAHEIIGIEPNTGNLEWRYEIGNQWKQNICMPVQIAPDTIFFSTSEAGSRGLRLTKNGDKTDTKELWSTKKVQLYHVNSVRDGDFVYGSTGNSAPNFIAAVNAKTGDIAWRKRGFAKATCIGADGKLIILDEEGQLGIATASPKDLVIHSQTKLLDKVSWTVPTVIGKSLYARDKKKIVAVDLG